MIPMLKKEKTAPDIKMHYSRMYWSVIGLYSAFAAEVLVRIPGIPFWTLVSIATVAIVTLGGLFFRKYLKHWESTFARGSSRAMQLTAHPAGR
jgi:hypothetical protein